MKPRKPTKRVTEFIPRDDEHEERPRDVPEFDPAEESFSNFRSKFGTEGVIVKIYRRTPRGAQYCFYGAPSEIDEEVIRLYHAKQPYAHEEGDYFCKAFVNGEARDSFSIPIAPQVAMPGAAPSGGMAADGAIVRALERLEQRLTQAPEREPLSSLADAMVKLQSMTARPELPIETLMKAIELGKSISGNNDGDDWKELIAGALKEAGPLLAGLMAPRAPAPAQQLALAPSGGSSMEVPQTDDTMLKLGIGYLKRKCIAGSDPGLYIDIILDNRDDATYQKLIHRVLNGNFEEFSAIDPEINSAQYVQFFKFIYDGLRSAFTQPNPMVSDSGRETGNKEDSASHGGPRKAGGKKS